jgi:hypothetical protein
MWLAVLFVGVSGGDFVSSSSTNGFTKIPVVVFLLPFVLAATIVIGRRGFTSTPGERHGAAAEETQASGRQDRARAIAGKARLIAAASGRVSLPNSRELIGRRFVAHWSSKWGPSAT